MESSLCGVCGQQSHGIHFGINACRACSSFFRRTVAERKSYVCRSNGTCMVKKGFRNACRACRFKKCFEAGMKPDNRKSIIHLNEEPQQNPPSVSSISSDLSIGSPINNAVKLRECRCLYDFVKIIHNYITSDRSLFTVENPDQIFCEVKFTAIKEIVYQKMIKSTVTLCFSMVCEFFEAIGEFSQTQKLDVLKSFFQEFHMLYQVYQSYKTFKPGENKLFFRYGYYVDGSDLAAFFTDHEMGKQANHLFLPFVTRLNTMSSKMRDLNLTEIEFAAIVGTLFFHKLDDLNLMNDLSKKRQNDLFADLNHHLIHVYGVDTAGSRMGQIFLLLIESKEFEHILSESMVIAKTFLPNFNDYWMDTLNS